MTKKSLLKSPVETTEASTVRVDTKVRKSPIKMIILLFSVMVLIQVSRTNMIARCLKKLYI